MVDFRQRNCNYRSKVQRQEEGSTKTGWEVSFCPFLQVFGPIAAAYFCPHLGGAKWLFHVALHMMQFLVLPLFDLLINFFHFHLGRKERLGGREKQFPFNCLFVLVYSPTLSDFSKRGWGCFVSLFLFSLVPMGKNDIFCLGRNQLLPQTPLKKLNLLN